MKKCVDNTFHMCYYIDVDKRYLQKRERECEDYDKKILCRM